MSHQSLAHAFQATAAADPDAVALRNPDDSTTYTWGQYSAAVERIAGALYARGVRRGDTVALMMANRPEFHVIDTAVLHLGATPFSVYNTLPAEDIAYLFENAGNAVVFADAAHVDRVRGAGAADVIAVEDLDALVAPEDFDFAATWQAVGPDDVLTLIYTSGTTGPPKGVEITHANMLAQCASVSELLPIERGDTITSYLPSAHIADRWSSHYNSIVFGVQITDVEDPRAVSQVLPALRPTIWGGVPRVLEKVKTALELAGVTDPAAMPEPARAAVRAKIGLDRVKWICVGAAPLSKEVHEYLLALGLPVVELYGMSEASCVITTVTPDDVKVGTVGRPISAVEIKVAEDGEMLVRGATITRGYRGLPDKTAEAIDADGWLHTGDVVEVDDEGYVRIVDRKKELIINAAGKNMSPANIEQKLKDSSPLIGQACVIGDSRPYNVALLVLDPDAAAGLDPADPDVQQQIAAAVERANEKLARVEQIKRFELLAEEWQPGGDELTPTMKLKRKPIGAKYADRIEALYAAAPA